MYLAMYPTHPSAAGQNAMVSYMINKNFQKVNAGIHAHTKQAGAGPVETPSLHLPPLLRLLPQLPLPPQLPLALPRFALLCPAISWMLR